MRLYLMLEMNKPVDATSLIHIMLDGYTVIAGGKWHHFEFHQTEGVVDEYNPEIVYFKESENEVYHNELKGHLHEITELKVCYLHTIERGNPGIIPVKILSFIIMDSGPGELTNIPESTDFVQCTPRLTDTDWTIDYELTENILSRAVIDYQRIKIRNSI